MVNSSSPGVANCLKFVSWGLDEDAARLKLPTYQGADVIINLRFGSGSQWERSKIRVEDIVDAFVAGESNQVIAGECGVDPREVEAIIRAQLKPPEFLIDRSLGSRSVPAALHAVGLAVCPSTRSADR